MPEQISFVKNPCWKVTRVSNYRIFFSNLSLLIPEDAVLFIEGTSIAESVKKFLDSRALPAPTDIDVGEGPFGENLPKERKFKLLGGEVRIFPRGDRFHIATTDENFQSLAKLSDAHAEPEMFDSLVVYRNNTALLHWYDPLSDPFYVSMGIPEMTLKKFCDKVQTNFKLES